MAALLAMFSQLGDGFEWLPETEGTTRKSYG
jgi:hypothetical protein